MQHSPCPISWIAIDSVLHRLLADAQIRDLKYTESDGRHFNAVVQFPTLHAVHPQPFSSCRSEIRKVVRRRLMYHLPSAFT